VDFPDVSRETLIPTYFPERQKEVARYAEMLATWGIERGLIGPREGDRIWERHIANCIPVSTLIPHGASVVDIGSGAGLPGIVIALARPDLRITLIEPLQRRCDFLTEVVEELGIEVSVIRGRAEAVKGSFGVVTARAVAALPKLLNVSWHLLAPGGLFLAMKGEAAAAELVEAQEINTKTFKKVADSEVKELELPGIPLARVVQLKKAG
jgi:16S rRNA (guanine527-N7)-methyltransferase